MTHKKYFSLAFTIMYILFSLASRANAATENAGNDKHSSTHAAKQSDAAAQGKHTTSSQEAHSKVPHGKAHAPHSEELPHIHKFHKERVKKIRKHHGKYWLLSQVLLFLCHASVLYISYLHVVH